MKEEEKTKKRKVIAERLYLKKKREDCGWEKKGEGRSVNYKL